MLDPIRLLFLRLNEWVGDLSPAGRQLLVATMVILIFVAAYFGLFPSRHTHYNPHALLNW